jgi:hypothetical protein
VQGEKSRRAGRPAARWGGAKQAAEAPSGPRGLTGVMRPRGWASGGVSRLSMERAGGACGFIKRSVRQHEVSHQHDAVLLGTGLAASPPARTWAVLPWASLQPLRARWRQDATAALQHTYPSDSRKRQWRHSPSQPRLLLVRALLPAAGLREVAEGA